MEERRQETGSLKVRTTVGRAGPTSPRLFTLLYSLSRHAPVQAVVLCYQRTYSTFCALVPNGWECVVVCRV